MSDERDQAENRSKDIVESFDLPQGEPTPPSGLASPAKPGQETGPPSAVPEPHVGEAEKKPSVTGKLVALVIIPVLAVIGIIVMRSVKSRPVDEYRAECKATAEKFLKGLSDDTEESVPAAYHMLHQDLQTELAAEAVTEQYAEATHALGKFKTLESIRWDESTGGTASRSFRALAQFEGGTFPMWFRFARVTSDGGTVVKIAGYKFGAK
jgi:hypothetical protein